MLIVDIADPTVLSYLVSFVKFYSIVRFKDEISIR